jgi:hypothetical protein
MNPAAGDGTPNPRGARPGRRGLVSALAALALSGAASAEPVAGLVARLAADDPAAREAAEDALVAKGPEALPELEAIARSCGWGDAEGAGRLAVCIARIREDEEWRRAEAVARASLKDRTCPHCREMFEADLRPVRSARVARLLHGARPFALRASCCSAASESASTLLVGAAGEVGPADLEPDGLLARSLVAAADLDQAVEIAAVACALAPAPDDFEDAVSTNLAGTRGEIPADGGFRVCVGQVPHARDFEFGPDGRIRLSRATGW